MNNRERRKTFNAPTYPGNYPGDVVKYYKNNFDTPNALREFFNPKPGDAILLAADIRNFTKTSSDADDIEVYTFLTQFFSAANQFIKQIPEAYVIKIIGDGFLAHLPSNSAVRVIEVAKQIMIYFINIKEKFNFGFTNLGIAISKSDIHMKGAIGDCNYMDFTIIGHSINKLFRTLACTEGAMTFISDNLRDIIKSQYHYIYLGEKTFKGILNKTACYSIIREKTEDERKYNKKLLCSKENCSEYFDVCHWAWKVGENCAATYNNNDIYHELKCSKCLNSKCWQYSYCLPKAINAQNDKDTECCHICSNFRNCYHAFHLGRHLEPLLKCDEDIYMFLKSTKDSFLPEKGGDNGSNSSKN
ncbi:MAG: adenylate/guanylate cyclase domain-containing protein [Nitrospirota bacterium]